MQINEKLIIDRTKDDYDIIKIKKESKWIYMGSKYNMQKEIEKFLEQIIEEQGKEKEFIIYGFGSGEHIKELRKKFKKNIIVVYEPNKEIFLYAQQTKLIKEDDRIYIEHDPKEIAEKFITEFNLKKIEIIPFSNYTKIYVEEYIELLKLFKDRYIDMKIESNTKMYFSERWFESLFSNLKYASESVWIDDYKDDYKDKPAIIVSAGPSLDNNIDLLKGIEENFLIITGGRPYKGLLDKGIKSSLMVNIDASEENYKLIENCVEEFDIPLLFFEVTNEKIVKKHYGTKIFSTFNSTISKMFEFDNIYLSSYGSVAHTMVSTAILLGCNPIIFIGQDCAYTKDRAHSEFLEERHKDDMFEDVKSKNDIWVDDIYGGKVRTSRALNGFRLKMEKIIEENSQNIFINATEGGARINGTIEMPLKEVIDKYGNQVVEPLLNKEVIRNNKEILMKNLKETKKEMKFIIKKLNEALAETDKLEKGVNFKKSNYIDEILNKLNRLDKCILDRIDSFGMIRYLLYPIVNNILSNDFNEDKKKIINKSRNLYEVLKFACEKGIEAIDSILINKVNDKESKMLGEK